MTKKSALPDDIKLRHETQVEHPINWNHEKEGLSDYFAQAAVDVMGFFGDLFFKNRYDHKVIVLETVAAVPGMVAAMFNHLSSLRKMKHDSGRIRVLMDEAENERMHLMTFLEIAKPSLLERALISGAQAGFFVAYSLAYIVDPRTAHRFVGFIEERAIESYNDYLKAVDEGRVENVDAPEIAKKYWNLPDDAKLRDVIIAVRDDEAEHRDVNHALADQLDAKRQSVDLKLA